MSQFIAHARLHATQQIKRHFRSPAIWALAIAGPIAARFLVPEAGASYSMVGVNDGILKLSASVIGLQLGVITAVLLAPLAYIFLRAGPTRTQPRQVTDATPRARPALSFGQWVGDVAALWFLLLILAIAGIVLSFFRLPLSEIAPFETLLAAMIIAAPALALIAAVRTVFTMRPALRKGWGDGLFFLIWMVSLIMSAAFFMDGSGGSAFADVFGFAAPMATGTSEPVTAMYIGGAPGTGRQIEFDAMAGVTAPDYLLSRLFWLIMAGLIACVAGFLFSHGKPKRSKARPAEAVGPAVFSTEPIKSVSSSASAFVTRLYTGIDGTIRPRWMWGPIIIAALAGLVFPLRGMVGPALVLLLIFPLTRYGSRWRPKSVEQWLSAAPVSQGVQLGQNLLIPILLCSALLLPSFLGLKTGEWRDVLAITVGLPVIAVGFGYITRGPVAARLTLLIFWYGYLNLGPVA